MFFVSVACERGGGGGGGGGGQARHLCLRLQLGDNDRGCHLLLLELCPQLGISGLVPSLLRSKHPPPALDCAGCSVPRSLSSPSHALSPLPQQPPPYRALNHRGRPLQPKILSTLKKKKKNKLLFFFPCIYLVFVEAPDCLYGGGSSVVDPTPRGGVAGHEVAGAPGMVVDQSNI